MDKEEAIERGRHAQERLNGSWELQIVKIYGKETTFRWFLVNENFVLTYDNKGYFCKYRMDINDDISHDEEFCVSIKRFSNPMKAVLYKVNYIRKYQKELYKHISDISAKINNR